MTGPENLWEALGAAGSVASLIGLLIACLAERRARAAERRAKSAEEKVDAAIGRTRTAADVRASSVGYTAARLALAATSKGAWTSHVQEMRAAVANLCESAALTGDDRNEMRRIAAGLTDLAYKDPSSDRTLRAAADRIDRLTARGLNRLTTPERTNR